MPPLGVVSRSAGEALTVFRHSTIAVLGALRSGAPPAALMDVLRRFIGVTVIIMPVLTRGPGSDLDLEVFVIDRTGFMAARTGT